MKDDIQDKRQWKLSGPNSITEEAVNTAIQMIKLYHEETDFQRIPMEAETELMNLIREGRYKDFKGSSFEKFRDSHGSVIPSPLTNYTYIVIAAVTLFSRTAVSAGVAPDDAFDLADILLLYLSACTSVEEVHQVYQLAGTMFAKLVHRRLTEGKKQSFQLEKLRNYISRNIFQKITLTDLSRYAGLSESRISHLFADELGISVHRYIQKEKTDVACNLLMHTDRSVAEIAAYLGFASSGNFSVVFRKWQKMSPTEYRKRNYREVY
ncbi:hypothetical protein B5F07_09075 [Lachnoclostridium sp. An169]|uniref:helix-turn-helix domain-containing protein n=1 Tax=Lachnoclostridium sp. An169 TaxID=1965569 RepID=UPI000B39D3A6|nr:AraC family transcriptional regulator [Lachnoclostridium sp. An169]OUP83994.1 hypothetical protein B5F07_09075 [Lachnoclostridium sp. An169]